MVPRTVFVIEPDCIIVYNVIYKTMTVMDTADWKNFVVKKVTWNKSLTRFNVVKANSIVCTSTKNYVSKNFREF